MFVAFVYAILDVFALVCLVVIALVFKLNDIHNAIAVSKELKAEIQSNGDDTK